MKPKIHRFRREIRAFSLVEVVLAVGVVSFALLSVLAMLPIGLTSIQNAELLQATGNITDQIRGQFPLLSFTGGSIQGLTTSYYTSDGAPTTAGEANVYYRATFAPVSQPVVNTSFKPSNAINVTVTLTYPPNVWNQTAIFSFLVARQVGNN